MGAGGGNMVRTRIGDYVANPTANSSTLAGYAYPMIGDCASIFGLTSSLLPPSGVFTTFLLDL